MRAIASYSLLLLTTLATPASAHLDLQELGHHWALPTYARELHFQMLGMSAIAGLAMLAKLVAKIYRSRHNQR